MNKIFEKAVHKKWYPSGQLVNEKYVQINYFHVNAN